MQKAIRDPLSDVFGVELKMYTHTFVMGVKKEIEGCWASPKTKVKCRACGNALVKVPRDGHVNSAFWVNERPDGQVLKACPKKCLESKATSIMTYFLDNRQFMKAGSESWNWEWDYTKFQNGWILLDGQFIFCAHMEHVYAASKHVPDNYYNSPERYGFIKFSGSDYSWGKRPTKIQREKLEDIAMGRGYKLTDTDYVQMNSEYGSITIQRGKTSLVA